MSNCKHALIQFRYSVACKETRIYKDESYRTRRDHLECSLDSISEFQPQPRFSVVAFCARCGKSGEEFGVKIDWEELEIKSKRAKENFLYHAKKNT